MDISKLLSLMVEKGASDLFLTAGEGRSCYVGSASPLDRQTPTTRCTIDCSSRQVSTQDRITNDGCCTSPLILIAVERVTDGSCI